MDAENEVKPAVVEEAVPGPNLEALRDERCIPIAYNVIEEMATNFMPEGSNFQTIDARESASKFLGFMLAADLNVATEASYVPQLILGALAGLNLTVQSCDAIPTDDVRYTSIARKILGFVSEAKVQLTNMTPEQTIAAYAPIKEKINALFAEEKLSVLEVKYLMDGIFNSFTALNNTVSVSLEQSTAQAEAKLFGIDAMSDLTLKKVNDVLIAPAKE
jgi:hypothetical protein